MSEGAHAPAPVRRVVEAALLVVGPLAGVAAVIAVLALAILVVASFARLGSSGSPRAATIGTPVTGIACADALRDAGATRTRHLRSDCTTNHAITVADGWTLDGGGHTIFAVDPGGSALTGGVISVQDATAAIRNLTVDGAGLTAACVVDNGLSNLVGVAFIQASGETSGIKVRNIDRPLQAVAAPAVRDRKSCGSGIIVASASEPVVVSGNAVENVGYAGVQFEVAKASLANNIVTRAGVAGVLAVDGEVSMTPGNQISESDIGVHMAGTGSDGHIAGNTITSMSQIGREIILGSRGTIAENTITDAAYGIAILDAGATATVEENTVSWTASSLDTSSITGPAPICAGTGFPESAPASSLARIRRPSSPRAPLRRRPRSVWP